MCSAETPAETRAAALAALLTAATGVPSRLAATGAGIRVEADLPTELPPVTFAAILDALSAGARYGHQRTDVGDTVWVEIDDEFDDEPVTEPEPVTVTGDGTGTGEGTGTGDAHHDETDQEE
ncbi:hypothetical protein [Streptomyces sp. NPDC051567]|uniref:hypothetical protein n=1 Tax=Streptomyces sp. NPDC051567 TaxID=3365660 RepID=UPI00378E675B